MTLAVKNRLCYIDLLDFENCAGLAQLVEQLICKPSLPEIVNPVIVDNRSFLVDRTDDLVLTAFNIS